MNLHVTALVIGVVALLVGGAALFTGDSSVTYVNNPVGATPGVDVDSECTSQNGVTTCKKEIALLTATTTPAALRAPTFATSTLTYYACDLRTSTTTAYNVRLTRGTTAFSTSSAWLGGNYAAAAANALGTYVADVGTSTQTAHEKFVFAPGEWAVMSMQGGGGSFSPVGLCQAEWVVNQ